MTTPVEGKSPLAEALRTQRLVITAERLPPRGVDAAAVKQFAASLPKAVSALVVSENHEELRACALACAALLLKERVEPVLPLVSRDRNRIALQSDALGAALLGVTSLLCLSGDHQSLGVSPQAAGAFDLDPLQLLQALKALRDDGVLLGGEHAEPRPALFLGATAHPYLRPMELNLIQTKKKVAAGAQFMFTQPLWDLAGFNEWMTAVRDAGLHEKVAILASVRPLANAEQAEALRKSHPAGAPSEATVARLRKAGDPVREGVAVAAEMAAQAKEVAGVRGIHVLCAGCEAALAPLLEQAGLTRA